MREVTECEDLFVLESSANKQAGIGEERNLQVFCSNYEVNLTERSEMSKCEAQVCDHMTDEIALKKHYSSFLVLRNDTFREAEDSISFLGRIVATAFRHGIPSDLSLPLGFVWARLCEEESDLTSCLAEVDLLASLQLKDSGIHPRLQVFLDLQQRLLNSFMEGMSSVLPTEIFGYFSSTELRDLFCGNPDVDVDLLRKVVEYEGYLEHDQTITAFWKVLREMTSEQRKSFLQFVWARSRLPLKESDFEAPFKIQKKHSIDELPSASTCFFSLSLPDYKDEDILRKKLMFAIENVTTMESDYVTNDAEVGEGWRGL